MTQTINGVIVTSENQTRLMTKTEVDVELIENNLILVIDVIHRVIEDLISEDSLNMHIGNTHIKTLIEIKHSLSR